MKKLTNTRKLVMLAALPAAILMANNAMAAADVYGKINISVQQLSADVAGVDTQDTYALETNASRLGFKTSADLGDTGLKGVAKIEYEVQADDGDSTKTYGPGSSGNELKQRNIYAGVQGGFGTIIAGNFDTPMKESQGKVDQFNDYILGDIKNVLTKGEDRVSNIIMYSTPKLDSGLAFNLAVMPGEESDTAAGTDLNTDGDKTDNGLTDSISASVTYDSESLYLAFAVNDSVLNADIMRFTAQYKMGAFTVGAIIQQAELSDDDLNDNGVVDAWYDQEGYILSGSYTLGNNVFKAQYGASSNTDDASTVNTADVDVTSVLLGYDYKLGKDAMVYAYIADFSQEELVLADETNKSTFGVGYEQKF